MDLATPFTEAHPSKWLSNPRVQGGEWSCGLGFTINWSCSDQRAGGYANVKSCLVWGSLCWAVLTAQFGSL